MMKAISEVVPGLATSDLLRRKPRYLRDMSKRTTLYRHQLTDGRTHLRVSPLSIFP